MASLPFSKKYRCVPSLRPFYSGGAFAVSSDGSFLACASGESINIVNTSNSLIRSTLEGDTEAFTALTLSPDDKLLFSASHTLQIRVWELSTCKCLFSWKAHDQPVMAMVCHPSGKYFATGAADKKVIVWKPTCGFSPVCFTGPGHEGVVSTLLFPPDPTEKLLFSASHDTTVNVWDLETKKRIAILSGHHSAVTSMALSEDGRMLLTAGKDKVVILWNLDDYSCLKTVTTDEVLEAVCVIPSTTLLYSHLGSSKLHNGKKSKLHVTYFITVGDRGIVRIWNSERAVCLFEQKCSDVAITSDDVESKRGFTAASMLPLDLGLLCVTADQEFLFYSLIGSREGTVEFSLRKRLVGNNGEILDMKFLGDQEQFIAVATSSEQVRVFDVASMSCSRVLAGHTETVMCLDTCVSNSGRTLIATGSKDRSVRLWDLDTSCIGLCLAHSGFVGAIAFSQKQRDFFVSGSSDGTLMVWSFDCLSDNVEKPIKLKEKAVVQAHFKDINSVAVAPKDSLVCSGSQDHTARVWKLPDLVPVVVLKGHKRAVWCVEFSPVEQCVLTASGDKTIKIWAISDGSCLKTFEGHMSCVYRASFLNHGVQFISSDADGLVKLWMVYTEECIATYDQHEDKISALTVGKKSEMIATGSGDAAINLWCDRTAWSIDLKTLNKAEKSTWDMTFVVWPNYVLMLAEWPFGGTFLTAKEVFDFQACSKGTTLIFSYKNNSFVVGVESRETFEGKPKTYIAGEYRQKFEVFGDQTCVAYTGHVQIGKEFIDHVRGKLKGVKRKVTLPEVVALGYDFHPKSEGKADIFIGGLLKNGVPRMHRFLIDYNTKKSEMKKTCLIFNLPEGCFATGSGRKDAEVVFADAESTSLGQKQFVKRGMINACVENEMSGGVVSIIHLQTSKASEVSQCKTIDGLVEDFHYFDSKSRAIIMYNKQTQDYSYFQSWRKRMIPKMKFSIRSPLAQLADSDLVVALVELFKAEYVQEVLHLGEDDSYKNLRVKKYESEGKEFYLASFTEEFLIDLKDKLKDKLDEYDLIPDKFKVRADIDSDYRP